MVFLFDCDNDEILLPRAYDLIDDSKAFIELMRKTEVKDEEVDSKAALKIVLENMLKKLDSWEVTASGTFVTVDTATAKSLIGAADVGSPDTTKVTPRNDVLDADFSDIWIVGDYSDKNGATNGGYIAIHLMNALSTGGFQLQTSDKAKGQFAFTYTAHYSMAAQDTVPFEVYIKAGTAEA